MKLLAFLKNTLDNLSMAKTKTKKEETTASKEIEVVSKETTSTVDLLNPPFDPDIPEQKQRHFR